jgi:predicted RNA binding protein YcfA (HicA-like mRNA interferase family)
VSRWPSTKASRVLSVLLRIGWHIKRESGSHRVLERPDWPDAVFAFHDREEIGPKIVSSISQGNRLEA